MISSAAQWNTSVPGRMITSTPTKPINTATTRPRLVRSPNSGHASIATINGPVMLIDAALPIGIKPMAMK